jgi:hypothetical protein
MRRDSVLTTNAAIVQAADIVDLNNDLSFRIWDTSRGTLTVVVTPMWAHTDLTDGAVKCIFTARHRTATQDYDQLQYVRTNSTTGVWKYVRVVAGSIVGTASLTISGTGSCPDYSKSTKVSVRWTSASGGDLGLPALTLSIFVDGVAGASAQASGQSTPLDLGAYCSIGRHSPNVAIGGSGTPDLYADAYLAHLELRPFAQTDNEIKRTHAQLTLGNALRLVIG